MKARSDRVESFEVAIDKRLVDDDATGAFGRSSSPRSMRRPEISRCFVTSKKPALRCDIRPAAVASDRRTAGLRSARWNWIPS